MTWLAFLRGINVGGNKMVPMAELRQMLAELGFEEPRTLLQSGNVVLESTIESAAKLEKALEEATVERFGFSVDYMVRTLQELRKAMDVNPFPAEADKDPSHLLVVFLKDSAQLTLPLAGQQDERYELIGRELFAYFPSGIGRSKLALPREGTARNWNTLTKLRRLAES